MIKCRTVVCEGLDRWALVLEHGRLHQHRLPPRPFRSTRLQERESNLHHLENAPPFVHEETMGVHSRYIVFLGQSVRGTERRGRRRGKERQRKERGREREGSEEIEVGGGERRREKRERGIKRERASEKRSEKREEKRGRGMREEEEREGGKIKDQGAGGRR